MASGDANGTSGELLAPEKIAPRASSRGNSPVIDPPSKNLPDNCSTVQAAKGEDAKSLQKELPINV